MKKWEIVSAAAMTLALGAGMASAKLPPPTEEQKAAAAAAAAKEAEAAKKDAEELAKVIDRIVENYKKTHAATAPVPAVATPAKEAAKK